jgi:hypothetical protein
LFPCSQEDEATAPTPLADSLSLTVAELNVKVTELCVFTAKMANDVRELKVANKNLEWRLGEKEKRRPFSASSFFKLK